MPARLLFPVEQVVERSEVVLAQPSRCSGEKLLPTVLACFICRALAIRTVIIGMSASRIRVSPARSFLVSFPLFERKLRELLFLEQFAFEIADDTRGLDCIAGSVHLDLCFLASLVQSLDCLVVGRAIFRQLVLGDLQDC